MNLKKKLIILIFILTTITLSIINFKNTPKTYLYFLNFKTEKLTLGNFITLSFLTGLTTTITFSYIISKNEDITFNDDKLNMNYEIPKDDLIENNTETNESIKVRPPERDIRDCQPTISVNYRVIKQNDMQVNDMEDSNNANRYQNNDDWEEIESNW